MGNRTSKVVVAADYGIAVRSRGDIPAALEACMGSCGLILVATDLAPAFFDLGSGLAGELMQKFTNYNLKMAVVVPDPSVYGERFRELAREHRSHRLIRFTATEAEARDWLASDDGQ